MVRFSVSPSQEENEDKQMETVEDAVVLGVEEAQEDPPQDNSTDEKELDQTVSENIDEKQPVMTDADDVQKVNIDGNVKEEESKKNEQVEQNNELNDERNVKVEESEKNEHIKKDEEAGTRNMDKCC
eukprot:Platyproteum_vivax@DN8209_c0_g1_i1.p1